ncbi:transketolase, partial [Xylophilus sp. Kf1]|nr:transketolase [Xylophilus sp. Kf1]
LVDCKTIIGFGAPNKADSRKAHGSPLGADEIAATRAAYGWSHEPFHLPNQIVADWRAIGQRGAAQRTAWNDRVDALSDEARNDFARRIGNEVHPRLNAII